MTIQKLTPLRLFFFATGLFAVQTFWGFNFATIPLYLMELTNSEAVTGLIIASAGIFGLLLPVVAGRLSDRIMTPWGRRKPFIFVGWASVTIILFLLPMTNSLTLAIPLILLLYASFFTALGPYFALLPDITPPEQRGTATGTMFFVGGLGMLSYLLFGARLWDTFRAGTFLWAQVSIVLSITVMLLGTREPGTAHQPAGRGKFIRAMRKQRGVIRFYIAMTLWWSGTWMVNSFFVIVARDLFDATTNEAISALFISTLTYVLFALPMGILGDRIGYRRLTICGLTLYGFLFTIAPFIGDIRTVYVIMALAGVSFSVILTVAYAFFLRLIPKEMTAGFVGIYMSCQNGSILIGSALGGIFIEYLGYPSLFLGAALFIATSLLVFLRIGE